MPFLWDYNKKELEKTEVGRIKLLENAINYGTKDGEKIKLSEVKKYWNRLELLQIRKRLFELLIWGKYNSTPKSRKLFWIR